MDINKAERNHVRIWTCMLALAIGFVVAYHHWASNSAMADSRILLEGRIVSTDNQPVPWIPVRAHREDSDITVSVYTDAQGNYSFPAWSNVVPGQYSVAVELRDFDEAKHDGVSIAAGKTARVDLTLQPRPVSWRDATATEIALAEPGTDDQRFMLTQCSNCHTIQWALRKPRTKDDWVRIVRMMAGQRRADTETPGTRAFGQKQYIEPLASYLASIRGPDSSDDIPFKVQPRPTGAASTRLVVTEYDLPRGGQHELYMLRGDSRFVWPHDVAVDANYAYYTDHFSYVLGRLNRKTGEVKEFPYTIPQGTGREGVPGDGRPGNPAGGAQEIVFNADGNLVFGVAGATGIFNPKTEQFKMWPGGDPGFGVDPAGNVWFLQSTGNLEMLNTKTGEITKHAIGQRDGIYGMVTDSKSRSILNVFAGGKLGIYDPATDKYVEYPTPTPGSGPRRGHLDAQGHEWLGLYWAGRVASFDPDKGEVQEFTLIPGTKPYGPPFPAPYIAAADDKNQIVWANDFNSSRIYSIDMKTGKPTGYAMPLPYEVRDLTVDTTADRPTVWIPAYRPPSKLVEVQLR